MDRDIENIFYNIKSKYGHVASWAIWKPANSEDALASNMGVNGLFDPEENTSLFSHLKTNIVMVGYNFSIPVDNFPTFHNFHSCEGIKLNHTTVRNASKLRYAFSSTPYWGAYMTDVIKNCVEAKSENVRLELSDLEEHFRIFRDELVTLKSQKPLIIAFGRKVYNLMKRHLKQDEYSNLVCVVHYAHYGAGCATHKGYRDQVLNQLACE